MNPLKRNLGQQIIVGLSVGCGALMYVYGILVGSDQSSIGERAIWETTRDTLVCFALALLVATLIVGLIKPKPARWWIIGFIVGVLSLVVITAQILVAMFTRTR